MLNALSSTLKTESDDQSRNAPPTMPSAVAFDWIPRTARRIESSDVLGNVFESWRTKNDPSSALCSSATGASERKSSGTNERSAKYAIIAARWVPRSAKNLLTTRLTGRQYARRRGCSPGNQRSDRDLAHGATRRRDRGGRLRDRHEPVRRSGRGAARDRREAAGRGGADASVGRRAARGGDAQRQRLRRTRRRADDRRDDDAGADSRPRLLRPQDLPALRRRAQEVGPAQARTVESDRRCRLVSS